MEFNLWSLLSDIAIFGLLLLVGQLLRAKLKIFQTLLMPAGLIGGFIGLALGPNGFNLLPFSGQLSAYAGVLIAVIFASTPIGDKPITKNDMKGVGGFFFQNTGILMLQYAAGMALTLFVLDKLWPGLNNGFGLILATGFYGGHGTAAAVGSMYRELGNPEFFDLGNASATVGLVFGIVFGMVMINWATRKGYTNYVKSPKELPQEIRTGLFPPEKQKSAGKITISNMSLDPLVFHLAIVAVATFCGRLFSLFVKSKVSWLDIPVFVSALAFGYVMQFILNVTRTDKYVDRYTIQRISGASTDLLVVSAMSALKISTVVSNWAPLLITFVFGLIMKMAWLLWVSKYSSPKDWFERGIMNFGRANGVIATGVLLSRVVDPEQKSRALEDTGITDLLNRPIAIALQVLPPLFLTKGGNWPIITTSVMSGGFIILTVVALAAKWWTPGRMQGGQEK